MFQSKRRTYESALQDIKDYPERHKHRDINDLTRCCFIDGALSFSLMEAHETYAPHGYNGGRACDVREGPCSCGAWH